MKQEVNLSIKEIETLCLLYNECRLSVQEETELEYILLCTAYSSDIINETKELMGLSRQMKLADDTSARHRRTPLQKNSYMDFVSSCKRCHNIDRKCFPV